MSRRRPRTNRKHIPDWYADLPLRELAESRELTPDQGKNRPEPNRTEGDK